MAIRVGGTVVIDDSRNLTNIAQINATTTNATTVCGTTVCGTLCGSLGAVSAANLTGIPAADQYICLIACETIAAGSPVSTCGTCGLIKTKGGPPAVCIGGGNGVYFSRQCGAGGLAATSLNFNCCKECFVSIQFVHGGGGCNDVLSFPYADPFVCIRVHNIGASGVITTACLCCFNYGCNGLCCVPGIYANTCWVYGWFPYGTGAMPLQSCTGSKGGIMVPYTCVAYQICCSNWDCYINHIAEYFFCYCTTTCTISLLRHCHGRAWLNGCATVETYPYVTNDKNYYVALFRSTCSQCNGQNCKDFGFTDMYSCTCAYTCGSTICAGMYVKALNDTMCLLSWTPASSCTGTAVQTVLSTVACCAILSTGKLSNCMPFYPGTMPFTQGADGWTLNYYNTFFDYTCANAGAGNRNDGKIWAHKAIADNVYSITNIICPWVCTCNIPFFYTSGCQWFCTGGGDQQTYLGNFAWDESNCKKMFTHWRGASSGVPYGCCATINCFCVSGTTLTLVATGAGTAQPCCCLELTCNYFYNQCITNVWQKNNMAGYVNTQSGAAHCLSLLYGTAIDQWALYQQAVPVCFQCSCYAMFTTCNTLLGSDVYPWSNGCGAGHNCCGATTGNNVTGYDGLISFYYFKPSYSGSGYINQVTCCGSSGSTTCLVGYNPYPILARSNSIIAAFTNSAATCYCNGSIYMGAGVQGYSPASVCSWLGVAQCGNTAGGIVQVATLGMIDRTSFSTALSSYAGSGCCIKAGFCCTLTVAPPYAINGLTIGNSSCGRLCNYSSAVIFRPYWDSAKGCYVTAMIARTTMDSVSSA